MDTRAMHPGAATPLASGPYFAAGADLDVAETFESHKVEGGGLSIGSFRRDRPGLGLTAPNSAAAMFMAVVTLRALPAHRGWRNGRPAEVPGRSPGALACMDFRDHWVSEMPHPFHTFHLFVSRAAFDELTDELGERPLDRLDCPNTDVINDRTMYGLALASLPLLEQSSKASALSVEHAMSAMTVHLAHAYGGVSEDARRPAGFLAPWQERRAKAMMTDDLRADVRTADLARACGLSPRHFERAFLKTTGSPPYRWRIQQRLDRAKAMLRNSREPLPQIALTCGFADQSHFNRVFTKYVGWSPGVYRRAGAS